MTMQSTIRPTMPQTMIRNTVATAPGRSTQGDSDEAKPLDLICIDRLRHEARGLRLTFTTGGERVETPLSPTETLASIRSANLDLIVDTNDVAGAFHAINDPDEARPISAYALSSRAARDAGATLRSEGFEVRYLPPVVLTDVLNEVSGWLRATAR